MEQTKLTLAQKLIEISKSVLYLQKDKQGYNYKYVKGSTALAAIKPKMNELGVLLITKINKAEFFHNIENMKKYDNKKGIEYNVSVAAETVKCDVTMIWLDAESSETIEVPWFCIGTKDDGSQAFGSALTYSERYFLLKQFNIATDDLDPEEFNSAYNKDLSEEEKATTDTYPPKAETQQNSTPIEQKVQDFVAKNDVKLLDSLQLKRLVAVAKANDLTNEEVSMVIKEQGFESSKKITVGKFEAVIKALEDRAHSKRLASEV